MSKETLHATTVIDASPAAVFGVLARPSSHAAIDGTGWVRGAVDDELLTASGQIFRVGMYHPHHPNGTYEMCNEVLAFEPARTISWRPGYVADETGRLDFGGWLWRYDLTPIPADRTEVTLTYDWSGAEPKAREIIQFPPFPVAHLKTSLMHLAALVTG